MMKPTAIMLATFTGTCLALLAASTSMAAIPMPNQVVPVTATSENLLQEAKVNVAISIGPRYNRQDHGYRCSHRHSHCTNFYQGYYYQNMWWMGDHHDKHMKHKKHISSY
jgi:hypothetical protein